MTCTSESSNETHVSTLEPGAQGTSRLSRAHGYEEWPQDPEPSPGQGTQVSLGLRDVAGPPLTIRKRKDFLACARARRAAHPAMIVQGRDRREPDSGPLRVGYTCSKKVGNAVARNRAKRRLRAVAAEVMGTHGQPGWDYVLIGRAGATAETPFAEMVSALTKALSKIHKAS